LENLNVKEEQDIKLEEKKRFALGTEWGEMTDDIDYDTDIHFNSKKPKMTMAEIKRMNTAALQLKFHQLQRKFHLLEFKDEELQKHKSHLADNTTIVRHSKIPIPTIGRNVVKVGDSEFSYGYGYALNARIVLVPSHYTVISHIHLKLSNASAKKIPCEFVAELHVPGHLEGVKLLLTSSDVPFNGTKLNIPESEFPGIIIAPSFSQISSVKYLPEVGLLSYIADSVEGDCGQPVLDTETGNIVGFHIGVNKLNKQARVAYALALSPRLLGLIGDKVKDLGF
jgi:hypothetical protein